MAGARKRDRFRAPPGRLSLLRPRVHPEAPVLVVAVADQKRERCAERHSMAKAREHLHLVVLHRLPRAPPVACAPAAEVVVDLLALEREAGGKASHDRHEGWSMRLAGRDEGQGHSGNPSAARIVSTGAGRPTQSSNDAAPCATSTSSPFTTCAPALRAAVAVAVSGYVRSTSVCPGCRATSTSSRTEVALTTRSDPRICGGQSPLRENCVAVGSASRNAAAAPPSPRKPRGSRMEAGRGSPRPCSSPRRSRRAR